MGIPLYPGFAPLSLDMKGEMHPRLSLTTDGVSEFTFSSLYLFRHRYGYRVSRIGRGGSFVISGSHPAPPGAAARRFFMTPCEAPERGVLEGLFASHDYWKNISDAVLEPARQSLEEWGICAREDRDNFDYLYARSDLAELAGKKYHKKRNLVHQFAGAYSHEQRPLTPETAGAALEILEQWRQDKSAGTAAAAAGSAGAAEGEPTPAAASAAAPSIAGGEIGDYQAAREALEQLGSLALRGCVWFAGGKPAGYCLGESVAKGKMFAIHFEKALDRYKGIYQFMNKSFAGALPRFFAYINREQDLGDEGLRQAKMTYRPSGFVRKHVASIPGAAQPAGQPAQTAAQIAGQAADQPGQFAAQSARFAGQPSAAAGRREGGEG